MIKWPLNHILCDKNAPQNARKYPANVRKTKYKDKRGNSCCLPIRGNVAFSAFLLDGLTRSLKIHTQANVALPSVCMGERENLGLEVHWGHLGAPKSA